MARAATRPWISSAAGDSEPSSVETPSSSQPQCVYHAVTSVTNAQPIPRGGPGLPNGVSGFGRWFAKRSGLGGQQLILLKRPEDEDVSGDGFVAARVWVVVARFIQVSA